MEFVTDSYSFAASDGAIVLRACIDRPLNSDHSAFKYLNQYSNAMLEFAGDRLFLRVLELYNDSKDNYSRFVPYIYSYNCSVTYADEKYLSCLMSARLLRAANTICQGIDTVIIHNDKIIPPDLICRNRKGNKLALDTDGNPSIVQLLDGRPILQKIGKNRIS